MSSQWAKLSVISGVALGVRLAEVAQRLVGEDDAPAEGVVGGVALQHDHPVAGSAFRSRRAKYSPAGPPPITRRWIR
jgi:hypothetical protein